MISNENEILSKEAHLYAMAVTETKMIIAAKVVEDVYPAVRYQIKDIRRGMRKVRQEVFGMEKKMSVKQILDRMVSDKRIQTATALIIVTLILTACTNPAQVDASEAVTPSQPVATEVSPYPFYAAPTAEQVVLEPTPTMEITQTVEEENRAEIVRNINEFLVGNEGRYSDASLSDEIFIYGKGSWLDTQGVVEDSLGLFDVYDDSARVQGFNLGFMPGENCVWMFWGTKMGDEGKRVVLPVKIPLESIKYRIPIVFNYTDRLDLHNDVASSKVVKEVTADTIEGVVSAGNELIDRPIMLDFIYNYKGNMAEALRGVVNERGGSEEDYEKVLDVYTKMRDAHIASFCSFYSVMKNGYNESGCGTGYEGVVIDSKMETIDENWFQDGENIIATILTTNVDNME